MFAQDIKTQSVRDFVFPIGTVENGLFTLNGTAFFIGGDGVAVTAGHVCRDLATGNDPVALFATENGFFPIRVLDFEQHPNEDVAVIKLEGSWHSIIEVSVASENASCEYELWGYPERVAHEIRSSARNAEDAANAVRPDLIYNKGYVRRRISQPMPVSVYTGECFYELSEVAGSCCSGAPVIKRQRTPGPWRAFGGYIGEETASGHNSVGFSTRFDAIASWIPRLVGVPLGDVKATVRS
ncbi:hypothetical protein [Brevundimonas sp. TSRC1-1]|uniref:hypothetical protein n=1 Tax=Brevundimonas sp. TSRC1-1 TaxID=2804562 RepID=UPI003CF06E7B